MEVPLSVENLYGAFDRCGTSSMSGVFLLITFKRLIGINALLNCVSPYKRGSWAKMLARLLAQMDYTYNSTSVVRSETQPLSFLQDRCDSCDEGTFYSKAIHFTAINKCYSCLSGLSSSSGGFPA